MLSLVTTQASSQKHPSAGSQFVEVTREVYLMGTRCTLIIYAPDRRSGLGQLETFLRIMEKTEEELSTWRSDSALSRLNQHPLGLPFALEGRLCGLFKDILFWARETHWAFDPAIGALIEAWGIRTAKGRWPSAVELKAARERSGLSHLKLEVDPCQIVRQREVKIEAGAFGKGEALDRVFEQSQQGDDTRWLIDLGGQVMVRGVPAGQEAWKVPVAHPAQRDQPLLVLPLNSGALATSGGSERGVSVDGIRFNHILDPRNGLPVRFNGSVTVWHSRALTADILSTALYVMGPEQGLKWAEARGLAACFFLIPDSESCTELEVNIRATLPFKKRFFTDY
ncbi:FAD:protein FMN transferase [Acidobacteria bacterium AH-259-G07]|nr:FAD:protein FMN transferase [Acidobacteria bacterium AH-259-G07]